MSIRKLLNSCTKVIHIPPKAGLVSAILAVSTAALFIRFAQREVPSLVIAASRLCLAAAIIAPFAIIRKRMELRLLRKWEWFLLALSGAFLALHFACWVTSLEYTTVASSAVLVATSPLWVALLSPIFLREKISQPVAIGLVVALVGVIVIGISKACEFTAGGFTCQPLSGFFAGRSITGNFLALAGAWFSAGYLVVGRRVRTGLSLVSYTFVVYGLAGVILAAWVAFSGQKITGYSAGSYLWLAALALIPQLLGHSTFNWALRYLPATFVSVALLGEPVGSSILAMIFLRETPTLLEAVGAVIILIGIYLSSRT